MVPQRQVFRVCASNLASDESLGHQHMGAVYHRGRSQIASTSESHGGEYKGIIGATRELDYFSAFIRLREPDKSKDKTESANNIEVLKQVVERGEEATTSPEGLSYPKAKRGKKRGGLKGVLQCRRGGPTDREERDADTRQRIVGSWAGSAMVPQRQKGRGQGRPCRWASYQDSRK
ncbi:hypothetical protein B296_00048334 [Ensete ventricosum]|uniref:Uncharacterized protein n=1 Tax=Ensete ventricosum TaxID=4639 RepID=A0A426XIX2_ENSVE|nr:hypothetical protein B296_00048334 [Ensete ventricosum]